MKVSFKVWLILFICLALISCRSFQKKRFIASDQSFSLVVTFFSKGDGVDRKNFGEFKNLLAEKYSKLEYTETKYGREGETIFCFDLSIFKEKNREEFIEETKLILLKSTSVRLEENIPCSDK